jgi:hypothetical protein
MATWCTQETVQWGRRLYRVVFTIQVVLRILLKRNTGMASLLRAVMDQPIFANVEIAASGMAMPLVDNPRVRFLWN